MSSLKYPMSTSYKAVFLLSILMIFVVIIVGAMSGSKSVGFGIWYWGYTAWKMYKRDNVSLVSLQKTMLWFEGIAFALGFGVLLSSGEDVRRYVDVTPIGFLFIAIVTIGLTYLLFVFFSAQNGGVAKAASKQFLGDAIADKFWEVASVEFENARNTAVWARCYSECDGDEAKAKAQYLRIRASALSELGAEDSNVSNVIPNKDKPKLHLGQIAVWSFGVFAIAFGFNKIWDSDLNSISVTSSSQSKPHNPTYSISQIEAQKAPSPKMTSCQFEWNSDTKKFDRLIDSFVTYNVLKSYAIPKLGYDGLVAEKLALLRKADKEGDVSAAQPLAKEVQGLIITIYHKPEVGPNSFMDPGTQARLSALCSN
jgi:hypothetical protein